MAKLPQLLTQAKTEGWSDWIRSEADERAVLNGCVFDVNAGEGWCKFIEDYFVFTRGPDLGKPYKLLDWHRNGFLMPIFGWKRSREQKHLRRYRKGDVFIGKKQAKSTLCGVLCDAFLLAGPPRTEVYGVAHTRDQAGVIYREAAAFAKKSPEPKKCLKPLDSQKRIIYEAKGSFYQAMAGENGARAAEGIIPTLILMDEIHVQRDRALYDALAYACIASENALFLSVSTVGIEDRTTIWWEQYEYAKGIISGELHDDTRFAFIAQADEGCKDDAAMRADPAQWRKAMPALNVTVPESEIRAAVIEAENSPAKLNSLLRYVFNIPTAQVDRVIPMDKWKACQWTDGEFPDLSGRLCYAGLDVASSEDLTALALYFPPILDEPRGYLKLYFWCPAGKILERERKQMVFYRQWVREGVLLETPGDSIDHATILAFIRECQQKYHMKEFLFDKWNADAIVNPMEYDAVERIKVEQGFVGMSAFSSSFLGAVIEGKLWHDGNPVMSWCCGNAAGDTYQDAMVFSKKKSAEKIDGVIAAAMAVGRGIVKPAETPQLFLI
jgi:phage terminase large subunit-like protein